MIQEALIKPESIVVIGASENLQKPGGKILYNLQNGNFKGRLYVVNPARDSISGIKVHKSPDELPKVDLAILAVPAKFCPPAIEILLKKGTKAFIIISAGFSEENEEGKKLEDKIRGMINSYDATLIGPNCIGVLTPFHQSIFTSPIPKLDPKGCELISGSGATAVFIIETGMKKGLTFSSVYSVGNSAQTGVEDILEYLDNSFDPETSSPIKLLYIESIQNPDKLLKHASSLIRKGCRIAAIKAGGSEAGSRAATSHTGALASSDLAVDALFKKAGIVRCYGRDELTTIAGVFMCKELKGKNMAIITHAGGPAVMLTDALSNGGINIPSISGEKADSLKTGLFPGSSVSNPIDFLATGTAEQLGLIIDACEHDFDQIDAMAVIFGSPGLFPVRDVYTVLDQKIRSCRKPIYPILPSVVNVADDISYFTSLGHVNFPDEVELGNALVKIFQTHTPADENLDLDQVDIPAARRIIDNATDGYLPPDKVEKLLDCASIPRVKELSGKTENEVLRAAKSIGYPCVMKVVGPVHKTDVRGVVLDVHSDEHLLAEFRRMMKIKDVTAVLVQPMIKGHELFIGAKYEPKFGHVILCGLGGIFIEVLKDVSSGLAPLTLKEALSMIRSLKSYALIKGTRGHEGVNELLFAQIIVRLSSLLRFATEIVELDINPLIGLGDRIFAVDARIRISREK
ncbi:acetate--CoA ligase family protein [Saccharicrinis sp. FJH54]|uniref:acetate--CoA ligase family protein n=1 Tax=Saccharicrinis sp. FJH54 TaxID=3344665 RepID=UPI0035D4342F